MSIEKKDNCTKNNSLVLLNIDNDILSQLDDFCNKLDITRGECVSFLIDYNFYCCKDDSVVFDFICSLAKFFALSLRLKSK